MSRELAFESEDTERNTDGTFLRVLRFGVLINGKRVATRVIRSVLPPEPKEGKRGKKQA